MNKLAVCLLCLLLCLSALGLAEEEMLIVATNFPCYDLCREVAGDSARVVMLLPPGTEIHSYEPTPKDMITIGEADLFVYVGGESDTWVEELLSSFGENAPETFVLTDCVALLEEEHTEAMGQEEEEEEEEEMDEHVWTSPVNMMTLARGLQERLTALRPELGESFQGHCDEFVEELTDLDAEFRSIVENGVRKTIIFGDRFPFLYFVSEYGLDYDAAFPGCSEDSEPSVRTVVTLVDRVREEEIPVVFYIEYSSCRTADILCEETGARKLLFHSCHNVSQEELSQGASYVSLMRQNAENLRLALGEKE